MVNWIIFYLSIVKTKQQFYFNVPAVYSGGESKMILSSVVK